MRGFLKLSNSSPIPALHFLLGEPPAEALLHINTLTLFHNLWENNNTSVFELAKYILRMCENTSTTWSNHVQILCQMYALPSPLYLLENQLAWPKEKWSCLVKTWVIAFHEEKLRLEAETNSKMTFLNVRLTGLSGRPHKAIQDIKTTQDARKLRLHLKFLTSDFLTAERAAMDQPTLNPACTLCRAPIESIPHILVQCRAMAEVRDRIFPELMNTVALVQPNSNILNTVTPTQLAQFILDCTSINLSENIRIPAHNPGVKHIYRISRDWCFAVANERSRLLQRKSCESTTPQGRTHS